MAVKIRIMKGSRLSTQYVDMIKATAKEPLEDFAEYMSNTVQKRIKGGYNIQGRVMEHVKKSTLAKRKSNRRVQPLMDTGRMYRSFGKSKVKKKGRVYEVVVGERLPHYASIMDETLIPNRKPPLRNPRNFIGMSKKDRNLLVKLITDHVVGKK